jgi:hypothetical protein
VRARAPLMGEAPALCSKLDSAAGGRSPSDDACLEGPNERLDPGATLNAAA